MLPPRRSSAVRRRSHSPVRGRQRGPQRPAPRTRCPAGAGPWRGTLSDLPAISRALLAGLAGVRPAPAGDELHDLAAAAHARLALAQVHLEAVLERALDAVGMAEVVDRCATGVDPRCEHLLHRGRQLAVLLAFERARRAQWMHARAEQRLVG